MRDDRPQITAETFRNMEDMSFFTHARIFDDLLIIAQKETNCFVLRSSEGLIVLDAIWPCQQLRILTKKRMSAFSVNFH